MNPSNLSKIFGSLKYIPASLGIKVLEKAHPMFKSYFANVTAYGLDASKALDYLTSRFSNPNDFEQSLQSRNPDQLRSDERIAKNEIAASKAPGKALRNAAALASGFSLAPSGDQTEQVEESQGQHPTGPNLGPQTQAQEIAPRVGQIAKNIRDAPEQAKINPMNAANVASQAVKSGKEAPGRLETAIATKALQGATGSANLISQFPELGKYLDELIQAGNPPEQAAMQAKSVKKFQSQIQAIEQKAGDSFENVIAQLFGQGNGQQSQINSSKGNQSDESLLAHLGKILQM